MNDEAQPKPLKRETFMRHAKNNGEVGAGSIAVLGAGLMESYGIPVTPEMIAAGSCLIAAIGQRIKQD